MPFGFSYFTNTDLRNVYKLFLNVILKCVYFLSES